MTTEQKVIKAKVGLWELANSFVQSDSPPSINEACQSKSKLLQVLAQSKMSHTQCTLVCARRDELS
jgi:hypothetical protein